MEKNSKHNTNAMHTRHIHKIHTNECHTNTRVGTVHKLNDSSLE